MDTGIHSTEQEKYSSFDVIRKKWAVKVGDLQRVREMHASTSTATVNPCPQQVMTFPFVNKDGH